jgi:hypothetical protein
MVKVKNEPDATKYAIVHTLSHLVGSLRMRWAGHVARMGEERGVHRVLVGKPEGKRPLGRPRRSLEDNIKMDVFFYLYKTVYNPCFATRYSTGYLQR